MNLWLTTEIAERLETNGRKKERSSAQHARYLIVAGLDAEDREEELRRRKVETEDLEHQRKVSRKTGAKNTRRNEE